MKKRTLTLLFGFVFLTTQAQISMGIKASGGLSEVRMKNSPMHLLPLDYPRTWKCYPLFSWQSGLFFSMPYKKKSIFGADYLYSKINGKERTTTPMPDGFGNPTNKDITEDLWNHFSYFGLSAFYGYKIKKMTINLGWQLSFLLKNTAHYKNVMPGYPVLENDVSLIVRKEEMGGILKLLYEVSDNFTIESTLYSSYTNIYTDTNWVNRWLNQQLTFGLRYQLFSRDL